MFRVPRSALRACGSGLALALAALVKLVPLLLAPVLLRRWRWAGMAAFGAGVVALALPYLGSGAGALAGLGTEAGEAVFNDSLHYLLVRVAAPVTANASALVGLGSAAALAGASLVLAWRDDGTPEWPARAAAFLLGLALLLNAVVEPWYLTWMLPFVALFLGQRRGAKGEGRGARGERWMGSGGVEAEIGALGAAADGPSPLAPRLSLFATPLLGWLWLSGAVQLTDLTYLGPEYGRWWPIIRAIEYGPLFALLAWDGLRHLRRIAGRAEGRVAKDILG